MANPAPARLIGMAPVLDLVRVQRWRRALGCSLAAATIGLTGCAGSAKRVPGVPPALLTNPNEAQEFARRNLPPGVHAGDVLTDQPLYPDGDVADVYRAVLDTLLYTEGSKTSRLAVLYELAELRVVGCDKPACPFVPDHQSLIDTLTLQDFRRVTLTRRPIRHDFRYHLPLTLLTATVQTELTAIGEGLLRGVNQGTSMSEMPFWIGFMSKYPGAWGSVGLTQVGFNPAHTEAILQVRYKCGTYCGSMEMILLRKSERRWRIVERMPEASQFTDLGHTDLRFRGVGAQKPLVEVRAEFVADSIRKMRLLRVIRGVVTNSASGSPIVLARVSIRAGETPNTPWAQGYTDSLGRYRFSDLPLGSTNIVVHCPKYTRRPGEMISVAEAGVAAGTDTTVDFPIQLNLCDLARDTWVLSPRPRVLTSPAPPLLDSADIAAAHSGMYPSPDEAAIYTAVLNGMGGPAPGTVTLLLNKTRSLCAGPACADGYKQRVRYKPEVILSTLDNFLSVREMRLSLRPNFTARSDLISVYATRSDVVLIGDKALTYLQRQVNFSDSAYAVSRRGDARAYWEIIHLAYPSARAIVSLSAIGFSPRRKQALVEATTADINGFYASRMFVLNYADAEWRIVALF